MLESEYKINRMMLCFGGLLHSGFNYGTEHKIQYMLRYAPGKERVFLHMLQI